MVGTVRKSFRLRKRGNESEEEKDEDSVLGQEF